MTTFPTRLWLHLASKPALATTPFLRVTGTFPQSNLPASFAPELFELRGLLPYDITPQLMACDPDNFLRAVDVLAKANAGPVELNCGCPSPNAAGKNAGSGLLRDPEVFGATISRLARALGPRRLAIKMRLGIDKAEEFDALLGKVAALPLARLTVHGRTRAEKYAGRARWDLIGQAALATTTPTWASGDVVDGASLAALRAAAPRVAGVMIGRGALRNPWIFEELRRGEPIVPSGGVLANALACYGMLHELWLVMPKKIVGRVCSGRIGAYCGLEPRVWQSLAADLSGLLGVAPFALVNARHVPDLPLSPTSCARVKAIWGFMRSWVDTIYPTMASLRTKTLADVLGALLALDAPAVA